MIKHKKVSIIVPVYNGSSVITDCISSLENLEYPNSHLQIIIINDGSIDDTSSLIQKKDLSDIFTVIEHSENFGRAAARNTGLKEANGDIIIFLDSDMIIEAGFVKEHINALSSDSVVAVSGMLLADPNQPRTTLQYYLYEYQKRGAKQYGEQRPLPFNYLITGNMSIKREVFDKCGFFDTSYKGYGGEDTDYAIRIWERYPKGLRFSSRAISTHIHQEDINELEEKIFKYGSTNYLLLLDKHPKHKKALSADWINSLRGYIIINRLVYKVLKILYKIAPHALFIRYFIAYNLITGARGLKPK